MRFGKTFIFTIAVFGFLFVLFLRRLRSYNSELDQVILVEEKLDDKTLDVSNLQEVSQQIGNSAPKNKVRQFE